MVINPLELNTPPLEITCQHGYICGTNRIDKAVIAIGIRDRRLLLRNPNGHEIIQDIDRLVGLINTAWNKFYGLINELRDLYWQKPDS